MKPRYDWIFWFCNFVFSTLFAKVLRKIISFFRKWATKTSMSLWLIPIQFGINWSASNQSEASIYGSSIIKFQRRLGRKRPGQERRWSKEWWLCKNKMVAVHFRFTSILREPCHPIKNHQIHIFATFVPFSWHCNFSVCV